MIKIYLHHPEHALADIKLAIYPAVLSELDKKELTTLLSYLDFQKESFTNYSLEISKQQIQLHILPDTNKLSKHEELELRELTELARRKGINLNRYINKAKQAYPDLTFPDDLQETLKHPDWLKEWFPSEYRLHFSN